MEDGKEILHLITAYSYRSPSVDGWEAVYEKMEDEQTKADYKTLVDMQSNIEFIFVHYLIPGNNISVKLTFRWFDTNYMSNHSDPYSEDRAKLFDKAFSRFVFFDEVAKD